jgi:hypothetical protein
MTEMIMISTTPPQVGQTLTATGGSGGYQWYNEGSAISGATSATYTLQNSDIGCLISVESASGVFSSLVGPVLGSTVRYVSMTDGLDTNDGTTSIPGAPHGPWKTLAHVNAQTFAAGTSILFKRGDTWRTDGNAGNSLGAQLRPPSSGTAGNPIVFDAYGTGANPIIDGSWDASQTSQWTLTTTSNVWQSNQQFSPATGNGLPNNQANDVGNILWGFSPIGGTNVPPALQNASFGQMRGGGAGGIFYKAGDAQANIGTTQGNWNFNTDNFRVQIYSTSNPATAMPGLSLAIDTACIYIVGQSYLIFQNLTLNNCGMSPIMSQQAGTTGANNIIIRDCVIQWYGGGNQNGGNIVRFGDGIDIEGSAQHWLIERIWFYQGWDICVGPQCGGAHQDDITVRNCVCTKTGGFFVTFIFGTPTTVGLKLYNNTCYCAPDSWSVNQRSNGNANNLGLFLGALAQTSMIIENNIFAGIGGQGTNPGFGINGAGAHWSTTGNYANPFNYMWLDYNFWPKNTETGNSQQIALTVPGGGGNFNLKDWVKGVNTPTGAGTFTPALEVHGIFDQDPLYTNQGALNFVLQTGSPCRNAGLNLYSAGVVWDINKNPRPATGAFSMGAFQ